MVPLEHAAALASCWGAPLLETEARGHNGVLRAPEVLDEVVRIASQSDHRSTPLGD